jgi:hypothetical protein
MSEDDSQAWLQLRKIQLTNAPSNDVDRPGWRFTLRRSPDSISIVVPDKSALSLLKHVSHEAWDGYPIKAATPIAQRLWAFFLAEELRDLYSQLLD